MPWTEITREQYRRDELRYASDMTDAEWELIRRLLPRAHRRGRPRRTDLRSVVEAVLYILSTGCQWRALPQEFPPYSTVQGYFYAWRDTGRWQRIVSVLVRRARKKLGRAPKPTAAVIDSQSAPTTQAGGPRGYDAGKRIYGRKRHIVTDTNGLLLGVHVHPANVQDCHGAVALLKKVRMQFPRAEPRLCRSDLSWASNFSMHSRTAVHGPLRSLNGPKASKASSFCRDDGSLNEHSPGSADADVWPKTSRLLQLPKSHGYLSPISGS